MQAGPDDDDVVVMLPREEPAVIDVDSDDDVIVLPRPRQPRVRRVEEPEEEPEEERKIGWIVRTNCFRIELKPVEPTHSQYLGSIQITPDELPVPPDETVLDDSIVLKEEQEGKIVIYGQKRKGSPWKGANSYYAVVELGRVAATQQSLIFFGVEMRSYKSLGITLTASSRFNAQTDDGFFVDIYQKNNCIVRNWYDETPILGLMRDRLMKAAPYTLSHLYNAIHSQNPLETEFHAQEAEITREDFGNYFRELKFGRREPPNYEIYLDHLSSTLRPYQADAVRFMIERELIGTIRNGKEFQSEACGTDLHYFPHLGLFAKETYPIPSQRIRGGILAEEMGLGKTVELLALISTIQRDKPEPPMVKKSLLYHGYRNQDPIVATMEHLVSSVTAMIEGDRGIKKMAKERQKAINGNAFYNVQPMYSRTKALKCIGCGEKCAPDRVLLPPDYDLGSFECPGCMADTIIPGKATLIIVPNAIFTQWYEEIRRHIKENVKVELYQGLSTHGYKHPTLLADKDIVLTTYEVLEKELHFVEFKPRTGLRDRKRALASPSPLLSVDWWRICLDESQMIEGGGRKAAAMCLKLQSRARWCVTGTPLQKSLLDLTGLLAFLGIFPHSVPEIFAKALWLPYTHGQTDFLLDFVRQFFWRNNKVDISAQLTLPPVQTRLTELHFTPLEERTYQEGLAITKLRLRHEMRGAVWTNEPQRLLKDLHPSTFTSIWKHLCHLRACIVTGNAQGLGMGLQRRDQTEMFSPHVLFARLHLRARRKLLEANRALFSNRNGLGGLYFLWENYQGACEVYSNAWASIFKIQELNRKLCLAGGNLLDMLGDEEKDELENETAEVDEVIKKPIIVDSLQVYHLACAIRALADIYEPAKKFHEENTIGHVEKAVHDRFLASKVGTLQLELSGYLKAADKYHEGQEKLQGDPNEWLKTAFHTLERDPEQRSALSAYMVDMIGKESVANATKLTMRVAKRAVLHRSFFFEVVNHHGEHNHFPIEGKKLIANLERIMGEVRRNVGLIIYDLRKLVEESIKTDEISDTMRKVMTCDHYQEMMMSMEERRAIINSRIQQEGRAGRRVAKHMKDKVQQSDAGEGTSQQRFMFTDELDTEFLIATRCETCRLGRYIKDLKEALTGRPDSDITSDSVWSIELMVTKVAQLNSRMGHDENTKKRLAALYEDFNSWFSSIRPLIQTGATCLREVEAMGHQLVELEMSARRCEDGMEFFLPQPIGHTLDTKRILSKTMDKPVLQSFQLADKQLESELKREMAGISYLHAANVGSPGDCPICYSALDSVWMVFPCAHSVCKDCYKHLKTAAAKVQCPTCRQIANDYKVSKVMAQPHLPKLPLNRPGPSRAENLAPVDVALPVKISGIIMRIYEITAADKGAKILIFSSLESVLKALVGALKQCDINFVYIRAGTNRHANMQQFKASYATKVCVMPLSSGANGLNLTEANHVIFAEPILETSVEAQAIGRIDRFGQTKPTTVHHFVVKNTLEAEIYSITQNHLQDDGWTIQTLKDVFGLA
ncbi:unnamed protein product, partial [Mesorhabditis spiculigera]